MLVPTRELAAQVCGELEWLGGGRKLRVAAVYGGVGFGAQLKALRRGVDVLVACPGRLTDLIERREVRLDEVEIVVVDEADRMADMGFLPAVSALLDRHAADRQTLLFSATLDGAVDVLVRATSATPSRHMLPEADQLAATHHFWTVDRAKRVDLTAEIVGRRRPDDRVLPHQARRRRARQEARAARRAQPRRSTATARRASANAPSLRSPTARSSALVATDVAARGIHVDDVACVVHFDPPADDKDYVHRSGRTARAGAEGIVVSLVSSDQKGLAARFQRELGQRGGPTKPDVRRLGERVPDDAPAPRRAASPAAATSTATDGRPRGTIKWFDVAQGLRLHRARGGERDVFVHFSEIEGDGYRRLEEGQVVEFELAPGNKGEQARRVRVLAAA